MNIKHFMAVIVTLVIILAGCSNLVAMIVAINHLIQIKR